LSDWGSFHLYELLGAALTWTIWSWCFCHVTNAPPISSYGGPRARVGLRERLPPTQPSISPLSLAVLWSRWLIRTTVSSGCLLKCTRDPEPGSCFCPTIASPHACTRLLLLPGDTACAWPACDESRHSASLFLSWFPLRRLIRLFLCRVSSYARLAASSEPPATYSPSLPPRRARRTRLSPSRRTETIARCSARGSSTGRPTRGSAKLRPNTAHHLPHLGGRGHCGRTTGVPWSHKDHHRRGGWSNSSTPSLFISPPRPLLPSSLLSLVAVVRLLQGTPRCDRARDLRGAARACFVGLACYIPERLLH